MGVYLVAQNKSGEPKQLHLFPVHCLQPDFSLVLLPYYTLRSLLLFLSVLVYFFLLMLVSYLKRTADTEDGALDDFPGPRAWPISMALITFFANQTFFQLAIAFFSP